MIFTLLAPFLTEADKLIETNQAIKIEYFQIVDGKLIGWSKEGLIPAEFLKNFCKQW